MAKHCGWRRFPSLQVEEEQAILTVAGEEGRVQSTLTGEYAMIYGAGEYYHSIKGTFGDTA